MKLVPGICLEATRSNRGESGAGSCWWTVVPEG